VLLLPLGEQGPPTAPIASSLPWSCSIPLSTSLSLSGVEARLAAAATASRDGFVRVFGAKEIHFSCSTADPPVAKSNDLFLIIFLMK
jgi:hypothetical protein